MNCNQPYTITSKILILVGEISEKIVELKHNSHNNITPMLRQKNRIQSLVGTLEIEGNLLGEEKITDIIDGKKVLTTELEMVELQGTIKAYQELENYQHTNMDDLFKAHKILMNGTNNESSFRDSNVKVGKHTAPQRYLVPQLMNNLFEWLKNSDEHMLLRSCLFHYEFEFIHPFSDGNGSISRLWQSVILYDFNPLFSSLPIESIIRDNQKEYYRALEDATTAGESTIFIEFMLDIILQTIIKVGKEVGSKVGKEVGNKTVNQEMIIDLMKNNSKISAKKLSEKIGISVRKIEENISKLKKQGFIIRINGTRGYWEIKE